MRPSLVVRTLGLVIAVAGRSRWATALGRVWWLIPVLKVAQWWLSRRRTPVQRIRMAEGESLTVVSRSRR